MVPIRKQISAYNHSAPNNILYIVLHDTGNRNDTPRGNLNFFCEGPKGRSAHYFVGDYEIGQLVEDFDGSWHCGDGNGEHGITNHNSLGIEMCNTEYDITAATEQNALDLVLLKMKEHNVPFERVVRHFDASEKICPESWAANGWARWFAFKAKLAQALNMPAPAPVVVPTPVKAPLNFSYANNAQVVGEELFVRDAAGNRLPGRYVSNGDRVTVLDVSYSKQLALVEYPTQNGVRTGYVKNVPSIIKYYNQGQWHNGSTSENVYDGVGSRIGSLSPREAATPLYRKDGHLHVVYNTDKGVNTKSGYVVYNGGFSKF